MKFTREQQQVIDLRNRNLLVSAAAGSGKTAVLVERIISKITDKNTPVDIDKLLIVTFTNAAAAEMRERIGRAIEKELEENPKDIHLQKQQTLLYNAQITTIHSFCLFVIRNYFHKIDLEPDFRIGDEGELKLLRGDVLDRVLETYYKENDGDFIRLVETIATGKNDEKLKETILTLYHFAMSDPWPKEWLKQCLAPYEIDSAQEFSELPVAEAFLNYLKTITKQWVVMMEKCLSLSREEDGPNGYEQLLEKELEMLEEAAHHTGYSAYIRAIQRVDFARLPVIRNFQGDEKKKQYVQEIRNEIKDSRKKLLEQFSAAESEEMVEELKENEPVIRTLIQVTVDFIESYEKKKREKNILDFNDLEHFALEILVDSETKEPSLVARELQGQFQEVMVDEYQDSNYVQEAVLRSVAKENNMFMVGDVKQSIYRFRMARPELFMEKYDTYTESDSENQKIDLHKNFRSREEVLTTVNDVFYSVMHKDLGNVEYNHQAALYPGMEFPESVQQKMFGTEVLLADSNEFSEIEDVEAVMIAEKIKKLMESQEVTDKETGKLRSLEYRDVVILLRGLAGRGQQIVEVLKDYGIPAMASTGTGYFSAIEVQTVLNMLRLLDNPRQDIPMAAVLQSPMAGITEEEMAKIRIQFRDIPFYQSVFSYAKEGHEPALKEKIDRFLQKLQQFRDRVMDTPIHELVYQVVDETGYLDYVHALPGGEIRRGNLEMLLEKAVAYESTSYHGLFHFIRYINQLQKYEVDFGEAEEVMGGNVVHIMTIHKSKGLEFPVVFVAGMGKMLNQQDVRKRMVLHPQYGIGLDVTDLKRRIRIPSVMRQIIARQIQMENAGEELRVLYVALTRAKEKLILTGTLKNAAEKIEEYQYKGLDLEGKMGFLTRLKAATYYDWVLPVLVQKGTYHIQLFSGEEYCFSGLDKEIGYQRNKILLLELEKEVQTELSHSIAERLSYQYAYQNERDLKTKLSVSELKHRAMDQLRQEETDTEYMYPEAEQVCYVPEFMQNYTENQKEDPKENIGALRGTAMHRVLECFDFNRDFSTLNEQLQEMAENGKLEERLQQLVSGEKIETFFCSNLAKRMQNAARKGLLYKEKPFVMGKAAYEIEPETDSQVMVLVQGIMDAFFEEDGKLILVDYKTDAVKSARELSEKYQTQMDLYQEALQRATGKEVKEKILYSFKLQEEIRV